MSNTLTAEQEKLIAEVAEQHFRNFTSRNYGSPYSNFLSGMREVLSNPSRYALSSPLPKITKEKLEEMDKKVDEALASITPEEVEKYFPSNPLSDMYCVHCHVPIDADKIVVHGDVFRCPHCARRLVEKDYYRKIFNPTPPPKKQGASNPLSAEEDKRESAKVRHLQELLAHKTALLEALDRECGEKDQLINVMEIELKNFHEHAEESTPQPISADEREAAVHKIIMKYFSQYCSMEECRSALFEILAVPAPQLSAEQVKEVAEKLYNDLDEFARDVDSYEFGLPSFDKEKGIELIIAAITAHNQK